MAKQQTKGTHAPNRASKRGKGKEQDAYVKYERASKPFLQQKYEGETRGQLMKEFDYTTPMQLPRLVKITLNMGLGAAVQNPKIIESAIDELRAISGQAPVVTTAKRDIATYKLRKGHKIGCMVTLRGVRMWEFLHRYIHVALPRTRDFKGISPKGFDGRGNYSVGITEQIVFPEIDYDEIDSVRGLNISIVTTARTDAEGRALLKHLGMPFRKAASVQA